MPSKRVLRILGGLLPCRDRCDVSGSIERLTCEKLVFLVGSQGVLKPVPMTSVVGLQTPTAGMPIVALPLQGAELEKTGTPSPRPALQASHRSAALNPTIR
jgi:hypothetical protein